MYKIGGPELAEHIWIYKNILFVICHYIELQF